MSSNSTCGRTAAEGGMEDVPTLSVNDADNLGSSQLNRRVSLSATNRDLKKLRSNPRSCSYDNARSLSAVNVDLHVKTASRKLGVAHARIGPSATTIVPD